ncbi:MAG TPA: carboxypeptidase regulatory-like domain-containing protein [Edaphobacter sp.]|nr:carboxypeptidase regulatory-like domain-containing protein [Edaphobacter sp.]
MCLLMCLGAILSVSKAALASESHGQVTFQGLPVPGVTITAAQGSQRFVAISDQQGGYSFADLPDGTWTIVVAMQCFSTIEQTVTIAPNLPSMKWELKLLSLDQIMAESKAVKTETKPNLSASGDAASDKSEAAKPKDNAAVEAPKPPEDSAPSSSDGLLINGSVNNAATSQFSLAPAFGNNRSGKKGLYTGGIAVSLGNSALDARPYSLSGQSSPKSQYNQVTGVVTLGGPLKIPHLLPHGPNFYVGYQWSRTSEATTLSGLVPTEAERSGDLAGGEITPVAQAQALLKLYPLPNVFGNSLYNYQVPIVSNSHEDALQSRLDKTIGNKNQFYGGLAFQSIRADGSNLFGFLDTTNTLGINTNVNWVHRFNHSFFLTSGYKFSRSRTQVISNFENRVNISGAAGITGNNQDPINWGPPELIFSSGIASLSDAQSSFDRRETNSVSSSLQWIRGHHNVTVGGDFRRQESNYLSQQDPRGTFTFTGGATGQSDFADFLKGLPDTSSIAFGNADKYLRQSVYDAYVTDDWRLRPDLTIHAGVRWEYGAPISELYGRLVNLDIAPGFSAVAPVLASDPTGTKTGERYPDTLIRPDRRGIEPRIGLSWRPLPGSSVVVRAGYGIYDDTSVYQATALEMAQQSPLSKSLSVQNSAACPQTLASGFNPCSSITANTFAVDPNFRVGYAQSWQLAVQSDLPGALQMTTTYLGIKGTRGVQEYLPNTYPIGAANPCPACPAGFVFRSSNGNSTREAGSLQLRRRLRSGFTASLLYTYSKSIDDDSVLGGQGPVAVATTTSNGLGGTTTATASSTPQTTVVAQNWLDLNAERGLSTFDQRNLLNAQVQYTTGVGLGGGALLRGWRGILLKKWTVTSLITAGSGLPQTPVFLAAVAGTGSTGSIRPKLTGASIYAAPAGFHLNAAAYTAPLTGEWGDARRNSIRGPSQFTLNASLQRSFRLKDRYNLDLRVDSTNLLNHVVFTSWNATLNPSLNNPLFGLPEAAKAMRSLQTNLRLRF